MTTSPEPKLILMADDDDDDRLLATMPSTNRSVGGRIAFCRDTGRN